MNLIFATWDAFEVFNLFRVGTRLTFFVFECIWILAKGAFSFIVIITLCIITDTASFSITVDKQFTDCTWNALKLTLEKIFT